MSECGPMTVRQLIELLVTLKQSAIVVLSKDGEGNAFSPLPNHASYSDGKYVAESTWSGDFQSHGNIEEMKEQGEPECAYYEDGVEAVCLWPTN